MKLIIVGALCLVGGWHLGTMGTKASLAKLNEEHQQDRQEMQHLLLVAESGAAVTSEEHKQELLDMQGRHEDNVGRRELDHKREIGQLQLDHGLELTQFSNTYAKDMATQSERLRAEFIENMRIALEEQGRSIGIAHGKEIRKWENEILRIQEAHQDQIAKLGEKHHGELLEMARYGKEDLEEKITAARQEGFFNGEQAAKFKMNLGKAKETT